MYTQTKDKVAAILCYFTWICWIVAFIIRDRDDELSHRHLNQGFVLAIIGSVATLLTRVGGLFDTIGNIVSLGVLILSIMGIVRAARNSGEPLPLIGNIRLI